MVDLVLAGTALVIVGLGIVVASMLVEGRGKGGVKGGGVVLLGPIPIIFGSDAKWASIAIVLAIVLILLVVIIGLV
jgi:uncharacterized protein (TIGR00304 family)